MDVIKRGKQAGEFQMEVLVDSFIGLIYYRLMMKTAPFTDAYVDELITQLMLGKRKAVQKRSK